MQNHMTMHTAPKRVHMWLVLLIGGAVILAAVAVWYNMPNDGTPGLGNESSSRNEMSAQNPQQPLPQTTCSDTCDQEKQDLSDMQFAQALTIKEITKNRNGVYVITFHELENVAIATVNEGPVEVLTQGSIINLLYKNLNGTFITCYIRLGTSPIIPPFSVAGCAP